MKKFLKYSFLFILPIVIAAISLEIMLRKVPNPYKYKYEWMQKNAEEVETIVLGSSHTFYGIRPEFLNGKAFSLANVSQDITLDVYLLEYWASRYKHLKTVIWPVSFFTWFSHGLEYGSEVYRCRYYKIYMYCHLYSDSPMYRFEFSDVRTAMGKVAKLSKRDFVSEYDEYGWGTTYQLSKKNMTQWNNGIEAEAAVKRHTAKNWDYIEDNYAQLQQLARFCKARDIQLILITTPCWNTYTNNLNEEQLAKTYELTHKFASEFGLPYFDYLKDKRFTPDDFYDSNHLSDVGAEKFTKILAEDIKAIR